MFESSKAERGINEAGSYGIISEVLDDESRAAMSELVYFFCVLLGEASVRNWATYLHVSVVK